MNDNGTEIYITEVLVANLPSVLMSNGFPVLIAFVMIVEATRCCSGIYEQALLQSYFILQPTEGWSAPSRRDLEAAKIRNEHHKVQSLYDNE